MKKLILVLTLLFSISLLAANKEAKKVEKNVKSEEKSSSFKGLSDDNTGRIGVGLGANNITGGISAKYYFTDKLAAQAILGYAYYGGFSLGVDGVFQFMNLLKNNKDVLLPIYAGAGISGWFGNGYTFFNLSAVIGIAAQFKSIPIEITVELRPSFFLGDAFYGSNFYFQGGGAVRFYF